MSRKCPYCGEEVPTFSITCPKCYRDIPMEEKRSERSSGHTVPDDRAPATVRYSKTLILFLSIVPALFGIMGIGQIYQGKGEKGVKFLIVGSLSFVIMAFCTYQMITVKGWAFLLLGLFLLSLVVYVATFLMQLFDAYARTVFRF